MNQATWRNAQTVIAIVAGAAALVFGIIQDDAAMMTVGAGLIGFSPAAKGP